MNQNMTTLSIDLETYAGVDLARCGVYRYTESPDFEILLFAYAVDDGPVQVVDLAQGEQVPEEILRALTDPQVEKWAYNCAFERICLSAWLRRQHPAFFQGYGPAEDTTFQYLNPTSWRCSQVWGAYLGLPLSLKGLGEVLNLSQQKMQQGEELIRYFCKPCAPTLVNGGRTRNLPGHAPEKWQVFKAYNRQDVETEKAIRERLKYFPVPLFIWQQYRLDQQINDRGILLDMPLVEQALALDAKTKQRLSHYMQAVTGLRNPNSTAQLKAWLAAKGVETLSLDKKTVARLMENAGEEVQQVLHMRQQLAKSSVSKYKAMATMCCEDHRARGCFQFYGASRTGRWAGRGIQLQNLAQNHMDKLSEARSMVRTGAFEDLAGCHDNLSAALSELIRTALIPRPGYKFIVADFSAIEARVLSFLAGESWRTEVFRTGGDIYCASASHMFGVPVVKNGENGHLRQKGKVAELALGYGGSTGALKAMGALEMGLKEEELLPLVTSWRKANPRIVEFWRRIDTTVKDVIWQRKKDVHVGPFDFSFESNMLFIGLPSGRRLAYVRPKIIYGNTLGVTVGYEGNLSGKWEKLESYGPKFVENIVQAVSRDILAYAMQNLSSCFICGHVHDELIIECPVDTDLQEICERMGQTPPWMKGLLLRADGYECDFYQKS